MGLTPLFVDSAPVQGLDAGAASPTTALVFAVFTALGMLAGVWTIRRFEPWAIRHTGELIAFAAGLLVSGALMHLIPHASDLVGADHAMVWTMISFLGFYLLEAHFIPHVHARGETPLDEQLHDHTHHDDHHLGPLVVAGLGLHSVVDGVSVGASLSAGPFLGTVAALLVVAHKMPVGIAAMSALYHSGVSGGRAALVTVGLAMVTPVMVMVSYFTFRGITDDALGVLLGLAGGSFLYVGAADLLPEGQARGRPANTLMFLAGAIVMIGVKLGVS